MIVINTKLYPEAFGDGMDKLLQVAGEAKKETGIEIVIVASVLAAAKYTEQNIVPIFVQHMDVYNDGKHTGYVSPREAEKLGIRGFILNHSEHSVARGSIARTVANKGKLISIVCVKSIGQAERLLKTCRPDYIAYEPSYLIGSKTSSIARERLDVYKKITDLCGKYAVKTLAGAGVKEKSDVSAVKSVGGYGVLVASEVVTSPDPKSAIMDLCSGFKV